MQTTAHAIAQTYNLIIWGFIVVLALTIAVGSPN